MSKTKLRQQCIDRTDLNARTAAFVSQRRGIDVIASVWNQKGKRGKPIQDLLAGSGPGEALQ